jgi:hypothetical protein
MKISFAPPLVPCLILTALFSLTLFSSGLDQSAGIGAIAAIIGSPLIYLFFLILNLIEKRTDDWIISSKCWLVSMSYILILSVIFAEISRNVDRSNFVSGYFFSFFLATVLILPMSGLRRAWVDETNANARE